LYFNSQFYTSHNHIHQIIEVGAKGNLSRYWLKICVLKKKKIKYLYNSDYKSIKIDILTFLMQMCISNNNKIYVGTYLKLF